MTPTCCRTIIWFKVDGHSFFARGLAKNDKANVFAKELKALKRLADLFLGVLRCGACCGGIRW
jgi:hypothetical protein